MKFSVLPQLFLIGLVLVPRAGGHDSPSHVIESLDRRLEQQGSTAGLLIARAFENEALGHWEAVIEDCLAVLEREPDSPFALHLCAEALLQLDRLDPAESLVRRGIAAGGRVSEQAPFHALLARVFTGQGRPLEALQAWRSALRSPQPEIDWFLGEAESLAQLSRYPERVDALTAACRRNSSIVLQRQRIRALVDAGEWDVALREIEHGLSGARLRSSWLLLRARIHGQNQNYDQQRADAATALNEIKSRLSPGNPDPYLLVEAAQALTLLGEKDEALACLDKARSLGMSEASLKQVFQSMDKGA